MNTQQLPQHIDLQELGLSFDIPMGWTGQLNGEAIVMGHTSVPGLMIAFQNHSKTVAELKDLAEKGITDDGLKLVPNEPFSINSESRVSGNYTGTFNGTPVTSFAVGRINGLGVGINVLILAQEQEFTARHVDEVEKVVQSVRFFESKDNEATVQWKNKLVGYQLKYLSTQSDTDYTGGSSGTSTRITIDLCTDGTFQYYSNTHDSFSAGNTNAETEDVNAQSGFGFSDSRSDHKGTYKIYSLGDRSFLGLYFEGGKEVEYDLSIQNGHTYLDHTRYLLLASERCS